MTLRRLALGLAMLWIASAVAFPASAAAEASDRRVFVVLVAPGGIQAWRADPALAGMLRDGASAVLVARAAGDAVDGEGARAAALATLGAGRRTATPADALLLRDALGMRRIPLLASDPGFGVAAPSTPEALPDGAVAILDASGPECGPGCLIPPVRAQMERGDALIVLGAVPAPERMREGVWLSVVSVVIEGFPPGLLGSPTTRRAGVVALVDVAPTVLTLAGAPIPAEMQGSAFNTHTAESPVARLASLERDLAEPVASRRPATRAWMIATMALLGVAAALVIRRGRAGAVVEAGLAAAAGMPAALLLLPLLPALSPAAATIVAGAIAVAVGAAARSALGAHAGVAAAAAVSAAVALSDLAAGGWLAARSPISFLIAGGARFYGIGNELMGVVIAGALAAAAWLGSSARRAPARTLAPLVAALVVGTMAAPSVGAKFGSVLVAVPGFAVLLASLAGRRLTLRLWAGIGLVTVAAAAAVYASDRLGSPEARSHIGRVTDGGGAADILSRKVDAAAGIASGSIWMQALLVAVLAGLAVWRFRGSAVRATLATHPGLAAALKASAVVVVLAPVTNDAGLIASTVIATVAVSLLLAAMGEADAVRRPGSPESARRSRGPAHAPQG